MPKGGQGGVDARAHGAAGQRRAQRLCHLAEFQPFGFGEAAQRRIDGGGGEIGGGEQPGRDGRASRGPPA